MGSDLRMGLDPRDCRCDAAMILGDGEIPDDIYWKQKDRDKTCVWLDFVDTHFSSLVDSEIVGLSVKKASVNVEMANISAQRKMSTTAETAESYNDTTLVDKMNDKNSESRITLTNTDAVRDNRIVTVNIPRKKTTVVSIENTTVETRGD
jgi:hypothetical protein